MPWRFPSKPNFDVPAAANREKPGATRGRFSACYSAGTIGHNRSGESTLSKPAIDSKGMPSGSHPYRSCSCMP